MTKHRPRTGWVYPGFPSVFRKSDDPKNNPDDKLRFWVREITKEDQEHALQSLVNDAQLDDALHRIAELEEAIEDEQRWADDYHKRLINLEAAARFFLSVYQEPVGNLNRRTDFVLAAKRMKEALEGSDE